MKYLSAKETLIIHALIIDETGGAHGIRDLELLQSIVYKPQSVFGGNELYKNIFQKAAIFLEALANYHVFVDGNKRTAFAATARFLFLNGYEVEVTNAETEITMVKVATKEKGLEEIETWLRENSKKLS